MSCTQPAQLHYIGSCPHTYAIVEAVTVIRTPPVEFNGLLRPLIALNMIYGIWIWRVVGDGSTGVRSEFVEINLILNTELNQANSYRLRRVDARNSDSVAELGLLEQAPKCGYHLGIF